jgi:hypothetical protein
MARTRAWGLHSCVVRTVWVRLAVLTQPYSSFQVLSLCRPAAPWLHSYLDAWHHQYTCNLRRVQFSSVASGEAGRGSRLHSCRDGTVYASAPHSHSANKLAAHADPKSPLAVGVCLQNGTQCAPEYDAQDPMTSTCSESTKGKGALLPFIRVMRVLMCEVSIRQGPPHIGTALA